MRKEIYNHRTIKNKDVKINGKEMAVRQVYFYEKYNDMMKTLVEVTVYDYDKGKNYSVWMYKPEFRHLCRCHWVYC